MNAILLLVLAATPAQTPSLSAAQPVVNLGTVRGGPVIAQTFEVANRGTAELEIIHVQPSCGCLAPRLSGHSLKPGETATVDVKIATVSQPEGDNLWSVRLFSRRAGSDKNDVLDLQVRAKLIREVSLEPSALKLSGRPGLSAQIRLSDRREKPLAITGFAGPSNFIKVVADGGWERAEVGWQLKVKVTVADDCPIGKHEAVAQIFSSDPDYRELRVPVTVARGDRQRYLVSPSDVRITMIPGEPAVALLLIRDRENQPVEIDQVECNDPAIGLKTTSGAQATAVVRVEVKPGATPAKTSTLRVKVKSPTPGEVVVPVTIKP